MRQHEPTVVTKAPQVADEFPASGSSRVILSKFGGGCGCLIPRAKGKGPDYPTNGPIWCGMESSSIPNHYFICAECYGKAGEQWRS